MNSKIYNSILLGEKIQKFAVKETIQQTKLGIIYVRVSDRKQITEGNGLDAQKRACIDGAQKDKIQIVATYTDEAKSGRSLERGGLGQALQFIKDSKKKGKAITHIYMTECSRLSRSQDLYDTLELEKKFLDEGIQFVFVNTPGLNVENSSSQLLKIVSHYSASQESQRISERTIIGQKNRVLDGYRPFAIPLGYKSGRVVDPLSGREEVLMQRDEPHATYVAQGLEKFATGELQTKSQLYRYLIANNVSTRRGRKAGSKLGLTAIDKIMESHRLLVYAGYTIYPKEGITDLIPARHESLISLDTAKQILARLKGKEKPVVKKRKDYDSNLPLRGLIYCSECNNKLTGAPCKGRNNYFHYYRCPCRLCSQKGKTIPADKLHEDVKYAMTGWKPDETLNEAFNLIFDQLLDESKQTVQNSHDGLRKRLLKIEQEIQTITNKVITLSSELLLQKLEEQLTKLEEEKQQIQLELDLKQEEKLDDELYQFTKDLFNNYEKIREIEDQELRRMLIAVQYNGKIYYKKSLGVLNSETSLSNLLFSMFGTNLPEWGVVTRNPVGITRR